MKASGRLSKRIHRRRDADPAEGLEKYGPTSRRVALPDPDEFVELMGRVRRKRRKG